MPEAVGRAEVDRILEITDRLGIHRETVVIPLGTRRPGSVRLTARGKLEIVVDSQEPFDEFLARLEEQIRGLPLVR
ncbi:MAG TPA: hypothetical protein VN083_08705 [Vicinamibacteria bacterium]|jgi:hypothetical protein|nr:hypothetical protein [Vicinamibacteria bacterium]